MMRMVIGAIKLHVKCLLEMSYNRITGQEVSQTPASSSLRVSRARGSPSANPYKDRWEVSLTTPSVNSPHPVDTILLEYTPTFLVLYSRHLSSLEPHRARSEPVLACDAV